MDCAVKQNYFEEKLSTLTEQGLNANNAAIEVIEAYLAGKPVRKKKQQKSNIDQLFWSSALLFELNVDVLNSEAFVLALARYFSVETVSNFNLLEIITYKAPEAMRKAIRASEIVLRPSSNKWTEIKQLASRVPGDLSELVAICSAFQRSHQESFQIHNCLGAHQVPDKPQRLGD